MIRHIVMINFKDEVTEQQRDEFAKLVRETVSQLPGTRNVVVGKALDVEGKPRYGYALLVDFDSEAALKSYIDNPTHKAAEAQMAPFLSETLISDYLY
jgi:quinol monooxygenase YgiN